MHQSTAQHLLVLLAFAAAFAALLLLIVSLGEVASERRLILVFILALPLTCYGLARRRRWQR